MKIFFWCLIFLCLFKNEIYSFKIFECVRDTNLFFCNSDSFNKKLLTNKELKATNIQRKTFRRKANTSSRDSFPIFLRKWNPRNSSNPQGIHRLGAKDDENKESEQTRAKDIETNNEIENEEGNGLNDTDGENDEDEIYYDLNQENVEKVLNLIRPKLQIDNGDVELVDIKDNNLYIRLLGNCVTCSSNSITVSEVIKKTLKKYIRKDNKQEPNVIITNFDEITEENIQNCLNQLKPYLDFIKIKILISNLIVNKENISNSVSLKFQNAEKDQDEMNLPSNIRNEITERIKQKFPTLQVNFEN